MKDEFCFPTRPGPARPFLHSVGPSFPLAPDTWRYAAIEVRKISAGDAFSIDTRPSSLRDEVVFGAPSSIDREACLVVLSGSCTVQPEGRDQAWDLPGRISPFEGPPWAAYVPPRSSARISAQTDLDIAIALAPASEGPEPRVIAPDPARVQVRGSGTTERLIRNVLMEDEPATTLLVTEVLTPAGHWSSYPPHKHDTDAPPVETYLEEIYWYQFRDPRGFGVHSIYTADRSIDESFAVHDNDLVVVPRGYHTFAAAPGYDAYYLNVMAGPKREWRISFDPDHERMRW